jgi:hypothetical protein
MGFTTLFLTYLYIRRHIKTFALKVFAFVFITRMLCYVFYPRPWGFTTISMLLVLNIADIYFNNRDNRKRYACCLLPIISILQINLHASMWYIVLFIALVCLVPSFNAETSVNDVKAHIKANKLLIGMVFLMIPCCLITPYGAESVLYLPLSYGQATKYDTISELAMPTMLSVFGVYVLLSLIFLFLYVRKRRCLDYIFLLALTGIFLAGLHKRDIFILSVFMTPCVTHVFEGFRYPCELYGSRYRGTAFYTYILTLCFVSLSFTRAFVGVNNGTLLPDSGYIPEKAADYLDDINAQGSRIYTSFNSGAYMEYRGYDVYIDARPELFQERINKKDDIYTEYMDINGSAAADFESFIDKYDFDYYLLLSDDFLLSYMQGTDDYDFLVGGAGYVLAKKHR